MPHAPIITVDEEKSQSRARLAICAVSLVGFSIIMAVQDLEARTLTQGFATILGYLAFALIWHTWLLRQPRRHLNRRYVAMTADIGIMVFWMHLCGAYVTSYYPIFLWVIVGNGLRFGARFLTVGIVLGALGFGSLLVFDEYWAENLNLGLGLLLGVVVLPVFFLTVLRRLRAVQKLEVELAKSRLADRTKDQFLAAMSHELRTPMNGVLGMAELLKDSELDHEQREQVNVITRSVDSLLNIINDILDYSKITANRLVLESTPFDLKQELTDVYLLLGPAAEDKGLELFFQYPEDVPTRHLGDPTRVRQIAFGLVGNAIKFTNEGRVVMRCEVAARGEESVVALHVIDTGIGIAPERQEAIFDVFEQADNSLNRKYEGSGLGLAIARRLAEMMRGEMTVRSEPGKGSTFTATLKIPICEVARPAASSRREALPSYGLHALVVEDNPFNQMVTRKMLLKLGITADIAENGALALEMIEKKDYALIFMDLRMPVMDGYEATRRIRDRDDGLTSIPILALTAEATDKARERCLAAGMAGYIAKPVRIEKIVAAVDACLAEAPPAGRAAALPHEPVDAV